jgi:hypothetical protein
MNGDL